MFTALAPVPLDLTVGTRTPSARLTTLDGAAVALVDNGKPRTSEVLSAIADQLRQIYPSLTVTGPFRTDTMMLASEEQLLNIASASQLVINGLGDCGACSACSVHVAIDFENLDVPAVAVCTQPFVMTINEMAARRGRPDYRAAIIQHPLASLPPEEICERAKEAVPQILKILELDSAPVGHAVH